MSKWEKRNRPVRLERRFDFENYEKTRNFLEQLGDLSELKKIFPDISFGKTYVNITLRPQDDSPDAQLQDVERQFALEIDELFH